MDWRRESAVEPIVDGALGDAKQVSKLLLLELMPGRTFYAIQGLLEHANDFVAGFVIRRREKESVRGLRVALNRVCISHVISSGENSPGDS